MAIINIIIKIINIISGAISRLLSYKTVFKITGFFATRKFPKAKKQHRYAILVAARNEETVIADLIDSVHAQDYPAELITIFVVADNCTDNTAYIARQAGAICYERFDPEHRTKGYALQFLVENIRRDYGIETFEGYFIFDADNLLKQDYISRMNESFDAGEKIITSYRNTKNFDDNWISASYALHWLRTVRTENRARSIFRLATRVQGTGYMFSSELIKDGWKYTCLTEDRELCANAVAEGYRISFNYDAQFYDEQPTELKIALRQRLRWAKGNLGVFYRTGGKLFKHIFVTNGIANKKNQVEESEPSNGKKLLRNIHFRFMSMDMLSIVYPRAAFLVFKRFIVYILRAVLVFGAAYNASIHIAPKLFSFIFNIFDITFAPKTMEYNLLLLTFFTVLSMLYIYLSAMVIAAYIFIMERKRIEPIKWYKKIWFCITFPLFDVIGKAAMIIAFFKKVEWLPIPHKVNMKIEDIKK